MVSDSVNLVDISDTSENYVIFIFLLGPLHGLFFFRGNISLNVRFSKNLKRFKQKIKGDNISVYYTTQRGKGLTKYQQLNRNRLYDYSLFKVF